MGSAIIYNYIDELLEYQYQKYLDYLKTFNIKDDEIKKIVVKEFTKPKGNISSNELRNVVLDNYPNTWRFVLDFICGFLR